MEHAVPVQLIGPPGGRAPVRGVPGLLVACRGTSPELEGGLQRGLHVGTVPLAQLDVHVGGPGPCRRGQRERERPVVHDQPAVGAHVAEGSHGDTGQHPAGGPGHQLQAHRERYDDQGAQCLVPHRDGTTQRMVAQPGVPGRVQHLDTGPGGGPGRRTAVGSDRLLPGAARQRRGHQLLLGAQHAVHAAQPGGHRRGPGGPGDRHRHGGDDRLRNCPRGCATGEHHRGEAEREPRSRPVAGGRRTTSQRSEVDGNPRGRQCRCQVLELGQPVHPGVVGGDGDVLTAAERVLDELAQVAPRSRLHEHPHPAVVQGEQGLPEPHRPHPLPGQRRPDLVGLGRVRRDERARPHLGEGLVDRQLGSQLLECLSHRREQRRVVRAAEGQPLHQRAGRADLVGNRVGRLRRREQHRLARAVVEGEPGTVLVTGQQLGEIARLGSAHGEEDTLGEAARRRHLPAEPPPEPQLLDQRVVVGHLDGTPRQQRAVLAGRVTGDDVGLQAEFTEHLCDGAVGGDHGLDRSVHLPEPALPFGGRSRFGREDRPARRGSLLRRPVEQVETGPGPGEPQAQVRQHPGVLAALAGEQPRDPAMVAGLTSAAVRRPATARASLTAGSLRDRGAAFEQSGQVGDRTCHQREAVPPGDPFVGGRGEVGEVGVRFLDAGGGQAGDLLRQPVGAVGLQEQHLRRPVHATPSWAPAGPAYSSRTAWALMPPKPKALMPARRGWSAPCTHGRGLVLR